MKLSPDLHDLPTWNGKCLDGEHGPVQSALNDFIGQQHNRMIKD